jgi:hypothetical protein
MFCYQICIFSRHLNPDEYSNCQVRDLKMLENEVKMSVLGEYGE